jgi:acyl dehydratase
VERFLAEGRAGGGLTMVVAGSEERYVGRDYPGRTVDITPDLVSEYRAGTADDNPWYSGDSPFGGAVAPALILHSECYKDLSWYLPNLYGNLHARQEWELFHPIMVGETVTTRSLIVDRYVKRDRDFLVKEVSCFGRDGRLLNRGRTHQSFLLDKSRTGVIVDKEREKRSDRRFEVGEGEALEEIPALEKQVTLEMCKKFSGPAVNYHNDVEAAKKLGFPDIVVQGMMTLCFLSQMMTERFGAGWYVGGRMNVALVNIVWGKDELTCRGRILERTPEGQGQRARAEVWCEKGDGTKVVVGTASAVEGQG